MLWNIFPPQSVNANEQRTHRKFLQIFSLLSFLKVNYDFFQELCLQKVRILWKTEAKILIAFSHFADSSNSSKCYCKGGKNLPPSTARSHQSEVSSTFAIPPTFLPQWSHGRMQEASSPIERLWKKSEKITITRQIKRSSKSNAYRSGIFQILEGKGGVSNSRKLEWEITFSPFSS